MKSKMKKLGRIPDDKRYYDESDFVKEVIEKINMIIDYLNSQGQEEENTVCEGCGKTITSRFMQSYTKGDGMHSYCLSCDPEKQDTPEEITAEQLCEDNRKRMERLINKEMEERGFIRKIKDTPEEWEKRFKETAERYYEDGSWVDIDSLVGFIKQLLEEREVFTKEELFMLKLAMNDIHNKGNSAYDEISEKIKRELDKLNKKK